jgi:hypothetical protein
MQRENKKNNGFRKKLLLLSFMPERMKLKDSKPHIQKFYSSIGPLTEKLGAVQYK